MTMVIPNSVKEIEWWVFTGCSSLKSVVIQGPLKKIEGMFRTNDGNPLSVETVTLPVGINNIDWKAFKNCPTLKAINVPAKKGDYYRKRLPEELHGLIVELPAEKKSK